MEEEQFVPEEAMEFCGVEVPVSRDEAIKAQREMAECFIEEYVRMGYSQEAIMELCKNPFYQGMHSILKFEGEKYIEDLINNTIKAWRGGH